VNTNAVRSAKRDGSEIMSGARARRRMKDKPVKVEHVGPVTKTQQMAAACTVSWYEASRTLGARQPGQMNEVPDGDYFRRAFEFSRADLLRYVEDNGLAEALYGKSLDQRCTPSAYIQEASGGYDVGWYDERPHVLRFHCRLEDAATDFVLRFWDMLPPDSGTDP
jgi:hypothetical protein